MAAEADEIVAAARRAGLTLRLLGGLAVRHYCRGLALCDRDHSDLDMAGLSREIVPVNDVLLEFGYREDRRVRVATSMRQAQFSRPCVHAGAPGGGSLHEDDHVDVFLDQFHMDHVIDLRARLHLEETTIPTSDVLLTKLQVARPDARDLRDALAILTTVELDGAERPGAVNLAYVSGLCADDWGLFYDVTRNLQRCLEALPSLRLAPLAEARARAALARLVGAVDKAPKTLRWRIRARVGTRLPWNHPVEEQDGRRPDGR